jgi:hypothetical protein
MNKTGEIRTIEPPNLQLRSGFYRDGFHVEAWIAAEAAPMGLFSVYHSYWRNTLSLLRPTAEAPVIYEIRFDSSMEDC